MSLPHLPPILLVYFVVYFVLGYFLYATLYALVGATVGSEEEAQQAQIKLHAGNLHGANNSKKAALMALVTELSASTPLLRFSYGALIVLRMKSDWQRQNQWLACRR